MNLTEQIQKCLEQYNEVKNNIQYLYCIQFEILDANLDEMKDLAIHYGRSLTYSDAFKAMTLLLTTELGNNVVLFIYSKKGKHTNEFKLDEEI